MLDFLFFSPPFFPFGGIIRLVIIFGIIFLIVKWVKGGPAEETGHRTDTDKPRKEQEIYQGLSRVEARIKALETIILDHERRRRTS
jgi:hypothetical protein